MKAFIKTALLGAMIFPSLASAKATTKTEALNRVAHSACSQTGALCELTNLTSGDEQKLFATPEARTELQNYLDQVADQMRNVRKSKALPQSKAELNDFENGIILELEIRTVIQLI